MSGSKQQVLDILQKAFQIEVDGYTFYSMVADKSDKPAVQELFGKLAADEVEHKAYLIGVMRGYDERGTAAFQIQRAAPDLKAFSASVFTDTFKRQAERAQFEMGVLSIGLQLENNALTYFAQAAREATDAHICSFYQFLADWEKEHFDALDRLYKGVREEFWAEGRFSPF